MPKQWIDKSGYTTLALCECGWRSLESNPPGAWGAALAHARHAHPEDAARARKALRECVSRHG